MGNEYDNNVDKKDELPENDSLLEKKRPRSRKSEDDDEDNIIKKIAKINEEIKMITSTQIVKKKEKIQKEIEEKKKSLKVLEKFEKIKEELSVLLKESLYKKLNNSKIIYDNREKQTVINDIRYTFNEYWKDNQKKLKPLYQSLNPENKKIVNYQLKVFEKQMLNEYLNSSETIKSSKNKKLSKIDDDMNIKEDLIKNKLSCKSMKEEKYGSKNDLKENENQEPNYIDKNNNSERNNCMDIQNNNTNELNQSKKDEIKNDINSINEFNNYSFNCLTKDLDLVASKGTKQVVFTLELENNGKFPWSKNKTTLSSDLTKSIIQMKEIVLEPLNPGEMTSVNVMLNEMDKFKAGEYYCYLDFKVDGKNYGNNIVIKIKITEKDIKSENGTITKVSKKYYSLPKSIASDIKSEGIYPSKTFENMSDKLLKSDYKNIQENKK